MNKEQEEFNEINNIVSKTINILSDDDFCKLWEYILNKRHEIISLNKIIDITKNNIDITIQIIKEQPTGNDEWILNRLNGFKYILQGSDKE